MDASQIVLGPPRGYVTTQPTPEGSFRVNIEMGEQGHGPSCVDDGP